MHWTRYRCLEGGLETEKGVRQLILGFLLALALWDIYGIMITFDGEFGCMAWSILLVEHWRSVGFARLRDAGQEALISLV